MTDTKFLKASAWRSIDSRKDWLIDIAKQILVNPEPGFFEKKTARLSIIRDMSYLCL